MRDNSLPSFHGFLTRFSFRPYAATASRPPVGGCYLRRNMYRVRRPRTHDIAFVCTQYRSTNFGPDVVSVSAGRVENTRDFYAGCRSTPPPRPHRCREKPLLCVRRQILTPGKPFFRVVNSPRMARSCITVCRQPRNPPLRRYTCTLKNRLKNRSRFRRFFFFNA